MRHGLASSRVKTTPYWLEERPPTRGRPSRIGRAGGDGDRRRRHRLRVRARARARQASRVRLHEARAIAAGASGRNGGFALRGLALPTTSRRAARAAQARELMAADRARRSTRSRRSPATRSSASEACGLRPTRRSSSRSRPSTTRCSPTASPSNGSTTCRSRSTALYRGALLHPADGSLQPARWVRRLAAAAAAAGAEILEQSPVDVDAARARGRRRRRRDRRLHARRSCPARRTRSGRRAGRCSPPSRSPSVATSGRTTRGTASTTGSSFRTAGSCSAAGATRRLDDRVDRRRGDDAGDPGARSRRSLASSPARCRAITHRWAGIWGTTPDGLPLAGRVPVATRVWVAPATRATATCSARLRRPRRATRSLGRAAPELLDACFDPARLRLELDSRGRSRSVRRACSSAASAIARSWIASPVESNTVISSASRRPAASPASTSPSSVTSSRSTKPAVDRVREVAVVARLLPVVAEDVAPAPSSAGGDLRLARAVRAHQADVLARPQRALRRRRTSRPGVTVTTTSAASASSRDAATSQPSSAATLLRALAVDVPERHGAAAREERPRRRAAVHARRRHRGGPRVRPRRASPRRARRRRPSAAPSRRPRRAPPRATPFDASESSTSPVTVGSPCAGLPGNDVTHLSSAWPPPSAGIARKSPAG